MYHMQFMMAHKKITVIMSNSDNLSTYILTHKPNLQNLIKYTFIMNGFVIMVTDVLEGVIEIHE